VSTLTFTIDPSAEFKEPEQNQPSIRDVLRRAQNGKSGQVKEQLENDNPAGDAGAKLSSSLNRSDLAFRDQLIANIVCPSNAVAKVHNSVYERYLISTTLRLNGTWVATYGRPNVRWPDANGPLAVAETQPYLAEALALADARIGIDDRRRATRVTHAPERRQRKSRRASSVKRENEQ
jgi:hypothetical protein